jgi:heme-degrading monooxygenase HmoA
MYARIVDCKLQPERRQDFNTTLRDSILPTVKNQPGFVELIGLMSDEQGNHALAVTFWKTKEDADRFYLQAAPMRDYLSTLTAEPPHVEHFHSVLQSSIS